MAKSKRVEGVKYDSDGFPSPFIPKSQKGRDYVLAFGKAIENNWENILSDTDTLWGQPHYMSELRRYSTGTQDVKKYQQWWELAKGDSGDTQTGMNFIPEPIPVAIKYKTLAIEAITSRDYTPVLEPLDPDAIEAKEKVKYEKLARIYSQDWYQKYSEMMGFLPQVEEQNEPQTPEELDVYMEAGGYKNAMCMAMEKLIIQELRDNKWDYKVKEQIAADMVVIGLGAAIDYVNPNGSLVVESVKPEDLRLPWIPQGPFDSSEAPYVGRMRDYTLEQLVRRAGDQFSEDEYKHIKAKYFGYYQDGAWIQRPFEPNGRYKDQQMYCRIMEFYFFSADVSKYKKTNTKSGFTYKKRSDEWEPNENGRSKAVVDEYKQVYQGCLIAGSNYIFDAGVMKYVPRQSRGSEKACLPIHVFVEEFFQTFSRSVMSMMIPFIDMYHFAWYNLQNMMASIIPPGVIAAIDSIMEVGKSSGNNIKDTDYIKAAKQTGNMLYHQYNELTYQNQIPVQFHDGFFPKTIAPLIEVMVTMVSVMENIIGFNSATNASTQSTETLVGVQNAQIFGTQKALSGLFRAFSRGCDSLYWSMMGRIQAIIQAGDTSYDKKAGEYTRMIIESLDDLCMKSFGVSVQVGMSEYEKQQMERYIELSLQQRATQNGVGGITIEDAIAIRRLPTLKMQEAMLLARRRRREREDAQRQEKLVKDEHEKIRMAGENQMQVLQMKNEADMQKNMAVMQQKIEADREKTIMEINASMQEVLEKAQNDIQKAQINYKATVDAAEISADGGIEKQKIANQKPEKSLN